MSAAYYEKLIDLWKAGKISEAISYLGEWGKKGMLSKEEIEELKKKIPDLGEFIVSEFKNLSPSTQRKIKRLLGIRES